MKNNEVKLDSLPNLQIDTGEVRQPRKKDGPLFYILPPLIVAAVFYYCATTPPPVPPKTPTAESSNQQMTTEDGAHGESEAEEGVDGDEE